MLQVCGHIKHVVVLVVLLCVINSVVISVPTYSLFTCMWIPCNCSHCENGSSEVLSLQSRSCRARLMQLAASRFATCLFCGAGTYGDVVAAVRVGVVAVAPAFGATAACVVRPVVVVVVLVVVIVHCTVQVIVIVVVGGVAAVVGCWLFFCCLFVFFRFCFLFFLFSVFGCLVVWLFCCLVVWLSGCETRKLWLVDVANDRNAGVTLDCVSFHFIFPIFAGTKKTNKK